MKGSVKASRKARLAQEPKLWKGIRLFCMDCVGTPDEIKLCTDHQCPLFEFRFGKPMKKEGSQSTVQ